MGSAHNSMPILAANRNGWAVLNPGRRRIRVRQPVVLVNWLEKVGNQQYRR
jgi:hypothetical protein